MTEAELLTEVIIRCRKHGVVPIHIDTPHHNKGRELKGYPDLILHGTHRLAFRELKSQTGRMRPDQTLWMYRQVGEGLDWGLWRPKDLKSGRIDRELAVLCRPGLPGPADEINSAFARAMAAPAVIPDA
jgi:hypothetical protein